jgi:hypothetical protein
MELLRTVQRRLLRHRTFRAVLAELESYSDRELMSDLRLTRANLPRLAHEEAARRGARAQASHPAEAGPRPG